MRGNRKQSSRPRRKQQVWKNPFVSTLSLQMEKWEMNKVIDVPGIMLEACGRDRGFMDAWNQSLTPKVIVAVPWEQWRLQMFPVQQKDFHWKPLSSCKNKVLVPLHKHSTYRALLHFFFLPSPSQFAKSGDWNTAVTDTPLKDIGFPSLKFKLEHPRRALLHLNKESTLYSEPGSFHSLSQCFVSFSISYIYNLYIYKML